MPSPVPRPRGHWLLGHLAEQRRDPLGLLVRGLREHGDVVGYRFGPYRALQLNHPRLIKRVLVDNAANYRKWSALKRARPLLGDGLVLATGESWKRRRRIYQPAFRRDRLEAMVPAMVAATRGLVDHLAGLPDGAEIDLLREVMRATLSIVSRTLMSRDIGGFGGFGKDGDEEELGRNFDAAVEAIGRRTLDLNPFAGLLPTARNRGIRRTIEAIDRQVHRIIAARRASGEPGADLLGWLLESGEQDGAPVDDRLLRDEVLNILLAGRGTSAIGLCWMWWLLDRHPEVEARVREEALAVLGPDRDPAAGDLDRLDLAARVFQEALRLYPPVWTIARQAIARDELDGGVPVAPGTIVLISPYVVHRHPGLWPDPERFDPDRFLPEAVEQRSRLAWIPFGLGPRTCVGGWFSIQEARILTAMVTRRFRLRAASPERPGLEPLITLKPRGGMPMRVHEVRL
ncbi:MAG: cytochrome P450 [Acidobacteriota bacterium]